MTAGAPLLGRTVLVTRGEAKGDRLGELLESLGAVVARVPLIATERLAAAGRLGEALDRLTGAGGPAWLVLTSATAVGFLAEQLGSHPIDGVSVAAVGPATEAALLAQGVTTQLVAAGQTADDLGRELAARGLEGARVLVVAAAGRRDELTPRLRAAGAAVESIEVYRSILPAEAPGQLRAVLRAASPDAVTFTSGSTVRHFSIALRDAAPPACPAVCIGPVTTAAAVEAGWSVVTATDHTAEGVATAVVRVLGAQRLP
jgi:uroporphyrinogen-III synthase